MSAYHTVEKRCYNLPPEGYLEGSTLVTLADFIARATEKHKGSYSYEHTKFHFATRPSDKILITCAQHGVFQQTINIHLYKGSGCPRCAKNEIENERKHKFKSSKGEAAVASYLELNGIPFIREATFEGCISPKTGRSLRYDFYIPKFKLLIEFDGVQHYKPSNFGSDKTYETGLTNLLRNKIHDKLKDNFANSANLKLVRIPYTEIKNINSILKALFKNLNNMVVTNQS